MQISQSEIIMRVRRFVHENFLYVHSNFQLGDDDHPLEKRVIDSMSIVEIIFFIEREFGINAMEDEVSHANFGSLAGIGRFVAEKQSVRAA
jgi:acyl carrier protein